MSATRTDYGGLGPKTYDDGVVIHGRHTSRWQKGGHDRIYPASAEEGYVDLNAGEIVEMTPEYDSGVEEYRMDYNAEKDALELVAVPRADVARTGAEESVVATIPRGLF